MKQILPFALWIGHARDINALGEITDRGIRAVVQLSEEDRPAAFPRDLVYCRFPLVDGPGNDPALLRLTIASVVAMIRGRIAALVGCSSGVSRSAAVCAIALAQYHEQAPAEWLEYVGKFGPLDVSPGLWADLCACGAHGSPQKHHD